MTEDTDIESAGGVIAEARDLIEDYLLPTLVELPEPGTGVVALAQATPGGIAAVPIDIFDAYRDRPKFRSGTAKLTKLDSLIAHINRFKDDDSVIFAIDDRKAPSLTAVLDYHRAGADADPRWRHHRAVFAFPLSDEWTAWTASNAKPMGMADFAAFLEDRIIDVIDLIADEDSLSEDLQRFIALCGGSIASAAKLIELSVGLKVNERAAVKEAINLKSGEAQVQFVSEHVDDAGAPLNVPGLFLIAIPVFQHGPMYRLAARLRYRKTPQGLLFFYELWRPDRTFDHAFGESCEYARIETDLPLLFGTPE
jgi:uncharacterized protein YfdQ (DUF2303 family)